MKNIGSNFDELLFFSQVRTRSGLFMVRPSLRSFRDMLIGMEYAFSFYSKESPLKYFGLFVKWYHEEIIKDLDGYACWWNHLLYTCANDDVYAFEVFFKKFERYLQEVHNVSLPDARC